MEQQWKQVTVNELKKRQISILKCVHQFCIENGISYWIDCGTLLGAIRHKGYIPWDDDIDIGMLRPDFDKFMKLFNQSHDKYKAYCIDNNSKFPYPYGKVLDTETLLYEPDIKGNKLSINIDIFVYDNAPDNDNLVEKMFDKRDKYYRLLNLRASHGTPNGKILRRLIVRCGRLFSKLFSPCYLCKKISNNSKKYQNKQTARVGYFTAYTRMVCEKAVFNSFIDVEFEGEKYKAPFGYDAWLKSFYGDYMQLPPPEKRISHHSFVAYIKKATI